MSENDDIGEDEEWTELEIVSSRSRMRRELLCGIDYALERGCVVQFESDTLTGYVLVKVTHRYGDRPARSMTEMMPPHDYENREPECWMGHIIEIISDVLTGSRERMDHMPPIIEEPA